MLYKLFLLYFVEEKCKGNMCEIFVFIYSNTFCLILYLRLDVLKFIKKIPEKHYNKYAEYLNFCINSEVVSIKAWKIADSIC